jgi:heptose I phosphotransferase
MPTLLPALTLLAGAGLLVGLALSLGGRRRGWLEIHPNYRTFFRRLGLTRAEAFLELPGVIVSGHPDRNVSRVPLDGGLVVYLKREHRVGWATRFVNALAGFGFVSRSIREARMLQALGREGSGCAEWLAAGEDSFGRAFLLVREVARAVELRTLLRGQYTPDVRRQLARRLGSALARLHDAGFVHPDLYAKHVLVDPLEWTIVFLDWQRANRRHRPSWKVCGRDLAALHATLAEELATERERLVCLRAYLRERAVENPIPCLIAQIQGETRRLLARRHIFEKRQPALPAGEGQDWIRLDGDALCVTSALKQLWPFRALQGLSLDYQPAPAAPLMRRWLALSGLPPALLVRRQSWRPWAIVWSWLRRRPLVSPEQRLAGLLFRLQRHAVAAPRVLAMGQRYTGAWHVESFLLTEPARDAVRLDAWLARQVDRSATASRRRLLRRSGALVRRLHEASCYLPPTAVRTLAVQVSARGEPVVVLDDVGNVQAYRATQLRLARRDVAVFQRELAIAGCDEGDLQSFLAGYRGLNAVATASLPRRGGRIDSREQSMDQNIQADVFLEKELPPPDSPISRPRPAPRGETERGESLWRRLFLGARRLRQRGDWVSFAGADWPGRIMDVAVTDRFHAKQGRSTGRWILHAPSRPGEPDRRLAVYLKRHYELPWWQGWLATLWPRGDWSPALQEWRHLEWARRQGVPVPEPVAAAEYVGPWGRMQSFLAVEELADMLPLHEAVPLASTRLDPTTFRRWKRTLVAEMARLTRMLHDRRCFHKDLYLCHFYIARADTAIVPDWRGRIYLIDLHRLAWHPWTWRLWQVKDLAQLLYSSEVAGVTPRDHLNFWSAYRGTGPRRRRDRWLRQLVLFKWRRYRRHNARRKQRLSAEGGSRSDLV